MKAILQHKSYIIDKVVTDYCYRRENEKQNIGLSRIFHFSMTADDNHWDQLSVVVWQAA